MHTKDLCIELEYNDHPIRVGILEDRIVYSFNDLLCALGVRTVNVTHSLKKVPSEHYYRASSIGNGNGTMVAITEEGATIALCRLYKVDMREVLKLLKWMKTVNKDKINKGA